MYQPIQSKQRGSYTANLLGNIRSHLAGLQGYDVMALELIQNADDAKAQKIVFDITDDRLVVHNSGEFTYCGDLNANPCGFQTKQGDNHICDYHRIADVGSGGKLLRSENIGRFGIGFLSVYQVTDRPEIRSAGIKLTLVPETAEWFIEPDDGSVGTTFLLPWARDPNTQARKQLGLSHITASHIDQVADDLRRVLRQSLLFLRYVRSAEVRRDGALLLACELDRSDEPNLSVSFRPSGEVEQWHILRADAAETAEHLCREHPQLAALNRSTKVGIGLRIEPELLPEGLLYAFLPTEQSSGLPLHINADFFPESDRKTVIFAGHQHEQAWNEMLMKTAAEEIACDPEGLLNMLGHVQLWEILSKAFKLTSEPSVPSCYKHFWERLKITSPLARIVPAEDGSVRQPDEVFLPDSSLTADQTKALLDAGGRLASEDLRPFWTAMEQLGAKKLTLERLVDLLESGLGALTADTSRIDEDRLNAFYRPLWSIVNDLLPDFVKPNTVADRAVRRLRGLPFVVTEDLCIVTINGSKALPVGGLDATRIAALLPTLAIASHHFVKFPKLRQRIQPLDLGTVVSHLRSKLTSEPVKKVIDIAPKSLSNLYTLFADIDNRGTVGSAVYESLRGLPIWRSSSRSLIKADEALLPGNFTDPIGLADLLDTSVLSEQAREFVSNKLGVKTLTIESYVKTVLPKFFDDTGPLDPKKYKRLIKELSNHSELLNEEKTCRLLGSLPLAPTRDGGWSQPTNTYHRSELLVKILGDTERLWLGRESAPQ